MVAFGAPPVDGLGSTGGFKLQVQDRADAGFEALQGAVENVIRGGEAQPGLVGLFSQLPRLAATALRRHRPHEGEGARRGARRRLRHPAGVPRLGVRERLHPLRPQLAGERAGGRGVPRTTGGHRGSQGAHARRQDGPAGDAALRARHHGSRHREPLQHVSVRRGVRGHRTRRQLGARRSPSWRGSPSASFRRAWASSGPS